MHAEVQSNLAKYQARPESIESLLDPRAIGWALVDQSSGLFLLFERDGEFRAELSLTLQGRVNMLLRGHSLDDDDVPRLENALMQAAVAADILSHNDNPRSADLNILRMLVADGIIQTLGIAALGILAANSSTIAKSRKSAAVGMAKRALDGIFKIKWPNRARGSGAKMPREVVVIEYARLLCQQLRRLPTKRELRAVLKTAGLGYSNRSKGVERKWQMLFLRAGLDRLPD